MAKEKEVPEVVDLRETVKVRGIKHKEPSKQHLVPGKVYDVHPIHAKNLVDTGHAEEYTEATKPGKK